MPAWQDSFVRVERSLGSGPGACSLGTRLSNPGRTFPASSERDAGSGDGRQPAHSQLAGDGERVPAGPGMTGRTRVPWLSGAVSLTIGLVSAQTESRSAQRSRRAGRLDPEGGNHGRPDEHHGCRERRERPGRRSARGSASDVLPRATPPAHGVGSGGAARAGPATAREPRALFDVPGLRQPRLSRRGRGDHRAPAATSASSGARCRPRHRWVAIDSR